MLKGIMEILKQTMKIVNVLKLTFLGFVCSFLGLAYSWLTNHITHEYTPKMLIAISIFIIINGLVLVCFAIEDNEV